MKIGLLPAASAAALCLLAAPTALAQPRADGGPPGAGYSEMRVDGGQVVVFPGDPLPGDTDDPYGGIVSPLPRVLRVQLIRPRMNFVSELLKSVENL